jgi:hypothetical protein
MSTIQQQKLKKLFQLSFFTLLMVASLLVISGGEQQQSFSQPSEQDTNSATTTQSTDFLTYDNATYGVTIQYPSNWIVDNTDFPGDPLTQIVGFFSPLESRVDTYEERLWIAQEQQSFSEDFNLAQYAEQIVSNYNSTLIDFSLDEIDTETATLGNNDSPAYRIVYTERLQPEDIDLKTLEIGTMIGDKVYVVMYHAETARYDQYLPIIEEMINSLELSDSEVDSAAELAGFLTYHNATYGVTIQYPSDWKVQEFKQSQSAKRGQSTTYHEIAGFVSPKLSITDQSFTEGVVISIEELGDNMTLDQYLAYTVALYNGSEVYPSSQVVSYSDDDLFLTSRNYPAYQVENTYYSVQTDSQNRAIEVGTIIEGKAYIISYRGDDKAEFSQFLPIVQQMIDSFDVFESKRT